MKLLFVTFCVIAAAHAEAHWDRNGLYKIIVTYPLEFQLDAKPVEEYNVEPASLEEYKLHPEHDKVGHEVEILAGPTHVEENRVVPEAEDVKKCDDNNMKPDSIDEYKEGPKPIKEYTNKNKPVKEFKIKHNPDKYTVVKFNGNRFDRYDPLNFYPYPNIYPIDPGFAPYYLHVFKPFHYDYKQIIDEKK